MWFIKAYIKIIFVKLIFKIFALEITKKKGPNILPRPGIHSLYLLSWSTYLAKTVFSNRNKLPIYIDSVKKKHNLTQKKTKRLNLIQI